MAHSSCGAYKTDVETPVEIFVDVLGMTEVNHLTVAGFRRCGVVKPGIRVVYLIEFCFFGFGDKIVDSVKEKYVVVFS